MFERIVVGVDASPESLEAVRQADTLLAPGGRLALVSVVDIAEAIHLGLAPTAIHAARRALEDVQELDRRATEALELARAEVVHSSDVGVLELGGSPAQGLLDGVLSEGATIVAVGTHGRSRAAGVVLGSVASRVLHHAPCSVLVARAPATGPWSPGAIVVGADGSAPAEAAQAAGRELESRLGATLRVLTIDDRRPARALEEAARDADLLVVGSRGVHGARALGSVSERVAHHAPCSVLVVRATPPA